MRTMRIAALMILVAASGLAGVHTETFQDFAGRDPLQTDACWDVQTGRLILPAVEASQATNLMSVTEGPGGGVYSLSLHLEVPEPGLYLRRYDSDGNPTWSGTGQYVPESRQTSEAEMVTLTDGSALVVWNEHQPVSRVLAHRYHPDGQTAWPAPVRVDQASAGTLVMRPTAAALPGGEAVVVWADRRSGNNRLYAQRLDSSGGPLWGASDLLVNPAGSGTIYETAVDTTAAGESYVLWTERSGDNDLLMTRVELNGSITWPANTMANTDPTEDEYDLTVAVVEGTGVFAAWKEDVGTHQRIRMIRREWDGSTSWGADQLVDSHADVVEDPSLVALPTGDLLLSYALGQNAAAQVHARRIATDGSDLGTRYSLDGPDGTSNHDRARFAPSAGGVMGIASRRALGVRRQWLHRLSQAGQPTWTAGLRLPLSPGVPYRTAPSFLEGSGGEGGFSLLWSENRDREIGVFGATYQDPQTPVSPADAGISSWTGRCSQGSGAQADDGARAAAWFEQTPTGDRIVGSWFDSNWNPLPGSGVLLASELEFPAPPMELALVLDQQGRAMVAWSGVTGGSSGAYLQGFDRNGSLVHPEPIRVDQAAPGIGHREVSLAAYQDGSVGVVWTEDGSPWEIKAQRIDAAGGRMWLSDTTVFSNPAATPFDPAVALQGSNLYVAVFQYEGGDARVDLTFVDSFGGIGATTQVSDTYDWIFDVTMTSFGGDLLLAFAGTTSSVYSIYARRLQNGVPIWPDTQISADLLGDVLDLALLQTGSNRFALVYAAMTDEGYRTRLQEISGAGTRTYPTDLPLKTQEPLFVSPAAGVSSELSAGPVHWASLEATDQANGGVLNYFLSGDGGASWHMVETGRHMVFPAPATDLRWGVDLFGEPTRQLSPSITQITTRWDEQPLAVDLLLNREVFRAGDTFSLQWRLANSGSPLLVEEYIALEAGGEYWFWPTWTQAVDSRTETLPTGIQSETILEFTWPEGVGAGSDLYFYAALVTPGTADLLGPWDWVSFGFM